ncbi:MAG: PAS domain S-box protein [Gammaproteobacteria bacterium]|nr:PAS domain S-box protein [Gammaproteobacteria bacterium]MBU1600494.1 PAS domain S-box protein [Gammaproteobacteria bacterium]MBU2434950.1 PAS domain S-box protein [Gammaproteobacteria bacterium]MBU2448186.1 PAS domain S-box protein [Gammaproteobacteria bacterium]
MAANGNEQQALRVVAFGASAGGLQALRPIIRGLKRQGTAVYVVAHHMSPKHPSNLPELLADRSETTVVQARNGERLLADHVYVCPPGHHIEVRGSYLALTTYDETDHITPSVDLLFQSVAESFGDRAVAVIVSGSGHDGTAGAGAINAMRGTVIVQLPEEAVQPGMPEAAIAAGVVDLIGGVDQIADWLNQVDGLKEVRNAEALDANTQTFAELFRRVTAATGLDLDQYKENTLRRQTIRRCRALDMDSLEEYLAHVTAQPDELQRLQQSFMISVSSFFRDPAAFEALEKTLRRLVAGKVPGDSIRVWVPGCATGEEPYSIAILLAEILAERLTSFAVHVFATDIDQGALELARVGVYPSEGLDGLSAERQERWFAQEGGDWRIKKAIRELCVFSLHDVTAHPPFIKMDLISCRNLLIYFKPEQQTELINTFHYALNPDGLLLLGRSESTGFNSPLFESLDGGQKVYRRRAGTAPRPLRFARLAMPISGAIRPILARANVAPQRQSLQSAALATIAGAYGPPGVLVNGSFEPLHFFGSSRRYFSLPEDTADFSVFALCLPELRNELKAIGYRLIQEGLSHLEGVSVEILVGGEVLRVRPVLRRVDSTPDSGEWTYLFSFEETRLPSGAVVATKDEGRTEDIVRLRQELADTREHLQAVIEELEASNEELQSLNEEVQSSSEELQASNEELQSSNEELTTLNDELRVKSQEATLLNNTLGNIQNSIRNSLVVVDREGRVTRYNPLAARIFGLVAGDLGQSLFGIPCHLQLPDLRANINGVVASGTSVVERVNQGEFHFLMQIDPYRNEVGNNAGAVLTFVDISDLYRAEAAQESSEVRFSQVWESSLEGLLVVDRGGRMVMANPAVEKMFGYDPGQLLGLSVEVLVPERIRQRHVGERNAFFRTPGQKRPMSVVRDICGVRSDGSELFVEISLSSMGVDGEHYALAAVADVTERKRVEAELERHRNSLEALVGERTSQLSDLYNRAPCGYHSLDANGVFVNINATECDWLGYRRDELIGQRRAIDLMTPDSQAIFQENFPRFLAAGELSGLEIEFRRKDGSPLPLLLNARAVYDEHGQFLHSLSTSIDNTVRKKAEQDWITARQAAETANRAKSAFLANMSHEIRTPLNAIIGLGHILKRGHVDSRQEELLVKIDRSAQHLLTVINDVLDLSKIEAEKLELQLSDFDLGEVTANIASMLQERAAAKALKLTVSCEPIGHRVRGDVTRFTQSLLNLASNAIKFTEAGDVAVRIRQLDERDGEVLVRAEVQDSGIGIAPEVMPRLFMPFEQADTSTTRKYGGTGLGLAITKRLAELMGGESGATSEVGVGSTFWFTAWLEKSAAGAVEDRPEDGVIGAEAELLSEFLGSAILLVEDEPINREVALTFLEDAGLTVTAVADGAEALAQARKNSFALVLMDMQMPVMDGLEATRQIRELPGWQAIPIIAMTANAFAEDRRRCFEAGMNDFVTKPFEPETLFASLRHWLTVGRGSSVSS